jgi:hypothetical protein
MLIIIAVKQGAVDFVADAGKLLISLKSSTSWCACLTSECETGVRLKVTGSS